MVDFRIYTGCRGYTFVDLLVGLTTLALLLALIWPGYQQGLQVKASAVVARDIEGVLNRTLGAWQASGGLISGTPTAAQVLTVLTSTPGINVNISNPGSGSSGTVSVVADGGTSSNIRLPTALITSLGLSGSTTGDVVSFDDGRYRISFDAQQLSFNVSLSAGQSAPASGSGGGVGGCGKGGGGASNAGLGDFVLTGITFVDDNNDGLQGAAEAGLASVGVSLSGSVSLTTQSDAQGAFAFTGLPTGTYSLSVTQPAGFLPGISRVGTLGGQVSNGTIGNITIDNSPGLAYTFGFIRGASLTGLAWEDVNADGVAQEAEPRLSDVSVELTGLNDLNELISVTALSNAQGVFTFATLRPGTYGLAVAAPAGYQTGARILGNAGGSLISSGIANISLAPEQAASGYAFAFTLLPNTPTPPDNVQLSHASGGGVTLSWNDNSSNETGFIIERSTGNGVWTQLTQTAANATSFTDTSAQDGVSYLYRVRALNAHGSSVNATSSSITAQNPPHLTPGTGFTGPTAQPAAIGSPSDFGYDAKAIARWDVVPFQTFSGSFNVGVVAFHINGIERVDFSVNNGPWKSVRNMTLNPQTNVVEYWATLNAALFPDGPIEVRAIAYPTIGEPRVLGGAIVADGSSAATNAGEHSMLLYANANGTLTHKVIYVAGTSGNDANDGSNISMPCQTLARAFRTIRTGGAPHHATITVIEAGDYALPWYSSSNDQYGSVVTATTGWVRVTSSTNLGPREVVISCAGRMSVRPRVNHLHFDRVSVNFQTIAQFYMDSPLWFNQCHWFDRTGAATVYAALVTPIRGLGYITDSTAEHLIYGFSGAAMMLVRNVSTNRVDGDVFSNTKLLINAHCGPVGGTGGGEWHSDVWQHFGYNENIIGYGLTSEALQDVQSIFLDHYASTHTDFALVNATFANTYSTPQAAANGGAPFSQLNAAHNNVLFRNVDLSSQRLVFRDDFDPPKRFEATNVVFEDCTLHSSFDPLTVPAGVSVR